MINRNTHLKGKPFLLEPAGKDYIWGGDKLRSAYGKDLDCQPLAETWECSTHPDGLSTVASGPYRGKTLSEVLRMHPEYMGEHPRQVAAMAGTPGQLPILIKLIDARRDLSVQVHPDDAFAAVRENGQMGKTEMWYVLEADPGSRLSYGFYHDISREVLRQSLLDGTIEKYLQKVCIKKDDVFFVEAGTVHAIGAGALLVEIQENSNLTYRMYDYHRLDRDGKTRPLHIEKAIDAARLTGSREPRQPMRVLRYRRGAASEVLCHCKYFHVERYLLNTEIARETITFRLSDTSFSVFLCIEGQGSLLLEDGACLPFRKGGCIFIPVNSGQVGFQGKAQLLGVCC